MRLIDRTQGRLHRHYTKTYGCRAWLRLPLTPSLFLAAALHRPLMCNHNTSPGVYTGAGP